MIRIETITGIVLLLIVGRGLWAWLYACRFIRWQNKQTVRGQFKRRHPLKSYFVRRWDVCWHVFRYGRFFPVQRTQR